MRLSILTVFFILTGTIAFAHGDSLASSARVYLDFADCGRESMELPMALQRYELAHHLAAGTLMVQVRTKTVSPACTPPHPCGSLTKTQLCLADFASVSPIFKVARVNSRNCASAAECELLRAQMTTDSAVLYAQTTYSQSIFGIGPRWVESIVVQPAQ